MDPTQHTDQVVEQLDLSEYIDLAAERLGGEVLLASDEFFASKENLIKAAAPIFRPGVYTEWGKWMDGWETRRRRTPDYDWCILRLGLSGVIRGVIVDTTHFSGNHPESCSLDACTADEDADPETLAGDATVWKQILPRLPLHGDARNLFRVSAGERFTHVRLNIYPDGGVARLRVLGDVVPDWERGLQPGTELDLASVEQGGRVLGASDGFFGTPQNLILPGAPENMGDGWETRRRRGAGHDWAVIRLGTRGVVRRIVVDTTHFKGNAPASCSIEGFDAADATLEELDSPGREPVVLLPETPLRPDACQFFTAELASSAPVTHVRLNIFPDGGVARLRVFCTLPDA